MSATDLPTPTGQTGEVQADTSFTTASQIRSRVRAIRRNRGLPDDPASDQIWVDRIRSGTHTLGDARTAIEDRAVEERQQQVVEQERREERSNARANIAATLRDYNFSESDISSLTDWAWGLVQGGASMNRVLVELPNRQEFQDRFPAIHQMREAGLNPPSASEIVQFERDVRTVTQRYNLPEEFSDTRHITTMLMNQVSPRDLEQNLDTLSTSILSQADEIRQVYAEQHGVSGISDGAILASAMTPGTPPHEFEQRIRSSQIAGTARRFGFQRDIGRADELSTFGVGLEQAQEFYRSAQQQVPQLERMRRRAFDPSDEFNIEQLERAVIEGDTDQNRRIRRLFSRERATFSPGTTFTRDQQTGALSGLRES